MLRKLLAVVAIALPVSAQHVPSTHTEITIDSVIAEMNRARSETGALPLREDKRLEAAANDRMKDMEDLGYWAHRSPDGRAPFVWYQLHGYSFSNAGENLAAGFETAEVLMDSWMESPGHRDNIMNPLYSDCGVAIIEGSTTGPANGKSIVVLFGRPLVEYVEEQPVRRQASQAAANAPRP